MNPIFYDTETTSLNGIIVLIQYAIGDGEVILYEPWLEPIHKTLKLIEDFCNHEDGIVGFNLTFDHFHLSKLYNTLRLYHDHNEIPRNIINELGVLEFQSRDGPCLKPKAVLDLFLHARKGPYQSTMERKPIKIKKVPTVLAYPLAEYLEKTIKLKDIYFARRKDRYAPRWKVEDFKYKDGQVDEDFKNIVLRFNASNALKALAADCLDLDNKEILLYGEVSIDERYVPKKNEEEYSYAPFALCVAPSYLKTKDWKGSWPSKIEYHIEHWHNSRLARQYAKDDVIYTRALYKHFDCPSMNDNDSVLACLVASCRLRGFTIDIEKIKKLKEEAILLSQSVPTAPERVRQYIYQHLSEIERVVLQENNRTNISETTKKVVLEEIAKQSEECETGSVPTTAAILARKVLEARSADYVINFYEKLLKAGRLHVDFKVIGTLSSRMAGGGGINAQGIKSTKEVRSCFPLASPPDILCGGDFISFEVVIAEALYNDPDLRKELQTVIVCPFCEETLKHSQCQGKGCNKCKYSGICPECSGTGKHRQTIHGLFGQLMYPGMSYVDILKTKGTAKDLYTQAKRGVFLYIYMGTAFAMEERIGIDKEIGERAIERFDRRYKKVGENNRKIKDLFCSMKQEGGIGSKITWQDPPEFVESLFGFRRYFTLENQICKALFILAENPPKEWLNLKIKVTRRDREQTIGNAVRSALFACAFNIQGQNTRSAGNHRVQSSGSHLTKGLQCKLWELQPYGIHNWNVQLMNIHDEILCVTNPNFTPQIEELVHNYVEENKKVIPLLGIDWKNKLDTWADK